jgi:hypothetical protein
MEYLGGLPQGHAAAVVEVTVRQRGLHFRHGGFLRGWSYDLPLALVVGVELTTARELAARGTLPAGVVALPEHQGGHLLAIEARQGEQTTSIVLRGRWAEVDQLRQTILRARMRAAKQWHP